MENIAFISLGSNLGDRFQYLKEAVMQLNNHESVELINMSSIYETDPIGYEEQSAFLNMVVKICTSLSPVSLLTRLQEIEREHGRKRDIRWGPRTLDLDILLFNQENIETEQLEIPHPRMTERAFVMIPLFEVDHDVQIPNQAHSISSIIDSLQDKEGVRVWKQKNGEDVYALFAN
ncbi:2-amino-4-hydroxy-6-hydroxymethyldihydropteridine diphosphokinase [Priestia abyssalis]|uniref:2-amino-4-hydroxy-6- hydroxymethyldihydropteridine diphosphokinase n=1 Tax=Priestia abyssalis TaxID=1221450 RepID=UPI0009951243|nr:2-amino-4-hydroxy-6-hydroxymethyldihydropteridine diphosphokinase [Priestia abyssalis]